MDITLNRNIAIRRISKMEKKLEIIYYELVKMEKRLSDKAEDILRARDEIADSLNRFEILQKQLLEKLEGEE